MVHPKKLGLLTIDGLNGAFRRNEIFGYCCSALPRSEEYLNLLEPNIYLTMEVHHHPFSASEGKSWKMYMWEFLMLFFAVVCGSFAEYLLEHKIERDRERQFVHTLVEDLAVDTVNINKAIAQFVNYTTRMDTVMDRFDLLGKKFDTKLYDNLFRISGYPVFYNCDRTMQQLKNSGAMRLISKSKCAKAIVDYDNRVKDVLDGNQTNLGSILNQDFFPKYYQIFDFKTMTRDANVMTGRELEKHGKLFLLKSDTQALGEFYNCIYVFQLVCKGVMKDEYELKLHAARLITLLKKEYKIQ